MARAATSERGYRLGVLSRSIAAIFGSYGLAALASVALALALPLDKRDAVQLATMVGFLLYTAAAIWAFSTVSAVRAWAGIGLACLPFALLLLFAKGLSS
ncbi:MAG: DUF3649 domain-containing protein [Sphingobium sp.]